MRVDRRVFVPMSDGVEVALTLYLPDGPGPFPAVVESVPYRKDDDCTARDWSTFAHLAGRGFAGVRVDVRGSGASGGVIADEYTEREIADSLEILSWVAAQPWCTGRVGMWGISWGGFAALQTAMRRPPELGAIVAVHATHDRFATDVHYTGGSLHIAESVDWPGSMVPLNALPPDPDIVGDEWFERWMERLDATPQWLPTWLRHQTRDEYWLHGSPCADYDSITCPTLLVGGWLDPYVSGMLALLEHLPGPRRAVVGPWGHYRPATGVPSPALDHLDLMARWFGHHLRGDDNGVMEMPALTMLSREQPPYDAAEVTGTWRAEPAWPPPDTVTMDLTLRDLAGTGDRWSGPQWVGSHAPFWDRGGWGSTDSDDDDRASLVFETEPAEEPFEILGTPELELTVTVDGLAGLVAARLLLVSPAGHGHLLCRGSRNLAFPTDLSTPVPVVPGHPTTVRFPLLVTSGVVPQGWRVRLALAGADFPLAWPPGRPFEMVVDRDRSRLRLPIVPPRPPDRRVEVPPVPAPPAPPTETVETDTGWSVEREEGTTLVRRRMIGSERQPERGDLVYTNRQWVEASVTDGDPASIVARSRAEVTLERPGWSVTTTGTIELTADPGHFRVRIEATAEHDGARVWSRGWQESVPRAWA